MSIFIGLPVAEKLAQQLTAELKQRAELQGLKHARWTTVKNCHLTLHFLGQLKEQQTLHLAQALQNHLEGMPAFSLSCNKIAKFPGDHGRIIAVDIELTDPLAKLRALTAKVIEAVGLQTEQRPYRPHLTLCRAKSLSTVAFQPIVLKDCDWQVEELILYESKPHQAGSHYDILQRYCLV